MLITKEASMVVHNCNVKRYQKLGYNVNIGDQITIPIEHLSRGNDYIVSVRCDVCGTIKDVHYKDYL